MHILSFLVRLGLTIVTSCCCCFILQVQTAAVIGGVATAGVAVAVLGAALFSAFLKDDRRRENPK